MNKNRHAERLPWVSKGVLEVNNSKYECFLDNISDEGALIRFIETDVPALIPGTVCTLKVILLNVVEYPCKVVRVNSPQVGLQFFEKHSS
jgi:hypothetical protein